MEDQGIKSFPWLRVVDVRSVNPGERFIGENGRIIWGATHGHYPIVEPNNVYGVFRLEDIKIPAGYEPDGETLEAAFKVPDANQCYTARYSSCVAKNSAPLDKLLSTGCDARRLCLRKIAPKTKKVVVLESEEPYTLSHYEKLSPGFGPWTVRIEERSI